MTRKKNIMFCSRDRTGQKPFLYYHKGKEFIFSSEIQAILQTPPFKKRSLNKKALYDYLYNHYTSGNQTLIKGVLKLPANSTMVVDLTSGEKKISPIKQTSEKYTNSLTLKEISKYPPA